MSSNSVENPFFLLSLGKRRELEGTAGHEYKTFQEGKERHWEQQVPKRDFSDNCLAFTGKVSRTPETNFCFDLASRTNLSECCDTTFSITSVQTNTNVVASIRRKKGRRAKGYFL